MSSRSERIEKIFERVEQECERRAQEPEHGKPTPTDTLCAATVAPVRRRGGSISVSRFGESARDSSESLGSSTSMPPPISSYVVRKPKFYEAQDHKGSADSLASSSEQHVHNDPDEVEVTQMKTFGGRQSLSRAVGSIIARRLSRSQSSSRDVVPSTTGGLVIGVSVEEATVEAESHEPQTTGSVSAVFAPRSISRRSSYLGVTDEDKNASLNGWTKKAKDLQSKFRRKSTASFPQGAPET
ncbi:hypothetical protein B0H21DRAFT_147433 [Amylocystis lapponica]|nr:hypothetical protein B0H21DRAFT_147433 [Amylocystis lapponica]